MAQQGEALAFGQFFLDFFDAVVAEFHRLAALLADEVIMVSVGPGGLVTGHAVAEMQLAGQPGLAEQLEGPVHGSLAYGRIPAEDLLIDFLQGMVPGEVEKNLRDGLALRGHVQSPRGHEAQKSVAGVVHEGVLVKVAPAADPSGADGRRRTDARQKTPRARRRRGSRSGDAPSLPHPA